MTKKKIKEEMKIWKEFVSKREWIYNELKIKRVIEMLLGEVERNNIKEIAHQILHLQYLIETFPEEGGN